MKSALWPLLLILEACMVGNGESAKQTTSRRVDAGGDAPTDAAPPIEIVAEPDYWIGFPMVVEITVSNPSPTRSWYALPSCRLLRAPGAVAFRWVEAGGATIELPAASTRAGEGPARGFDLEPGDSRTMLFDISELDPPLTPGVWTLTGTYTTPRGRSAAPPVTVSLVAPSEPDAAGAARLRSANGAGCASWSRLLDEGVDPLPDVELSAAAWRRLAFHEAVHRVVHDAAELEGVDPATFDGFDDGPLAGEAALLRLELLEARGSADAAPLRARIAERWPGLRWRLAELAAGHGFLAGLRASRPLAR